MLLLFYWDRLVDKTIRGSSSFFMVYPFLGLSPNSSETFSRIGGSFSAEAQHHDPASMTRLTPGTRKEGISLAWTGHWRSVEMCDFSLHNVKSRPAKVGDKLTTRDFGTGTRGFAASEDVSVAVCVLPGTELSFADEVRCESLWPWSKRKIGGHKTAIFRQVSMTARTAG